MSEAGPGRAEPPAGDPAPRGGGHYYAVHSSHQAFAGRVIRVRTDVVAMPGGTLSARDVVEHPGAVGVVALRGPAGSEQVLLVRQYRHPVRRPLWELPAGLLDVPGEPAAAAAARELAEEAGLRAAQWSLLVDVLTSPGGSDEAVRIFLAREVSEIDPADRHARQDEEAEMVTRWVGLGEAVGQVLSGVIVNALAGVGLLAADAARARDWSPLRPVGADWPDRPGHGG